MLTALLCSALWLHAGVEQSDPTLDAQARELKALISRAPELDFEPGEITVLPPREGWTLAPVSWVAVDAKGLIYLLQRTEDDDPVVVVGRDGNVVRSWGRGMYETPHAIRVDLEGNVWTADAKSSRILKFRPDGELLMEIAVGGQPPDCDGRFCGTSDVGFGPDGRIFIADGYRNARILEYTADGEKVGEWGSAGEGPGQFRLPHSIAVDDEGVVWVADRENGRIQRFDLDGNFLGMWTRYGKTFGLELEAGAIWLATQHRNEPNLSPAWLLKVDRQSGDLLGYVNVTGVHGMTVSGAGEPMSAAPAPGYPPRWFKSVNATR